MLRRNQATASSIDDATDQTTEMVRPAQAAADRRIGDRRTGERRQGERRGMEELRAEALQNVISRVEDRNFGGLKSQVQWNRGMKPARILLVVVAWRHLRPGPLPRIPRRSFALLGAASSFVSALLGSVGPLMAPFFLAYGLVKGAYIGTEALATVVMHVTKLVAYGNASLLTGSSVIIGLLMGPIMIVGSFVGKRIVDRLPEHVFVRIIEVVLVVAGLIFLIGG